jgi:hypothetical protein
LEGF